MDLKAILDYIGSILDYSPSNTTYRNQLVSIINDAYISCLASYSWPFAQETVDVTAYEDVAISLTFTNGSANFTAASGLSSTMDGHYVTVGSDTFRIGWIASGTSGWLQSIWTGTTGAKDCTIKYRYLHVPTTAQAIENVVVKGTGEQGTIPAITRVYAEDVNIDESLTGEPTQWVPVDADAIPAPRKVSGLATGVSIGQGTRTLDFAMTYVWAGRESALSPVTTATYSAVQNITWTPDVLSGTMPYYRRLYVRAPKHGLDGWRLVEDATSKQTDVSPLGTVTITPNLSQTTIESEAFAIQRPRYSGSPSGQAQRIMLYPRVGEKTVVSIRATTHPRPLEEDWDTPILPVQHRIFLAHRAIELVALKHDQVALAQSHAKRAQDAYNRMVVEAGGRGHKAPPGLAVGGSRRIISPFDISTRGKVVVS